MEHEPRNRNNRLEIARDVGLCALLGVTGAVLGGAGVNMAQHSEEISAARMAVVDSGALLCTGGAAWLWQEIWRS